MLKYGQNRKIKKTKKNYDVNIIKNRIQIFYKEKDKSINNFYLDEIDKITIQTISNYHGGFRKKFFYGIYDFEKSKGWIRLHGTTTKDFLLEVGLIEEGFFDVKAGNDFGVFASDENREKWHNVMYKKRFKNYTRLCNNFSNLSVILLRAGFGSGLLKKILGMKNIYNQGDIIHLKDLFYTQLKILTSIKQTDKDIKSFKKSVDTYYNGNYNDYLFEEKFGYSIKERIIKKYNTYLKYIGKENKILLYISYNNYSNYKENVLGLKRENNEDFLNYIEEDINKISNRKNINFTKRVEFMKKIHNYLFPGEDFFRF